ncbi:MAG: extracellular solute-binding protein [Desulforhopalus sp.]
MNRRLVLPVVFSLVLLLFCSALGIAEQLMSIWSINPNTPFGNLTDRMAQAFTERYPDTFLQSEHFSNDYYKFSLRSAIESYQAPDIFHNWGGSSIESYVEADRVIALDDIAGQLKEKVLPIGFDPVTFNGKIYGVPYSGLAGVFFWYRKDVFARLDLKPPATWHEFIEVGETLKENGIIPIALANKNKWPGSFFYMYLVDRIGGSLLFQEAFSGGKATFEHPAFIRAGELIQDMVKRDFFPKGFNRQRDEPGNWNSMIISGQAGMYLMGTWFLSVLNTLPPEMREKFDFFVFPEVEGGAGSRRDLVGSPGQDYLSISADSKNPSAAKKFLSEFICSETYFKELASQGFVPPIRNARKYLNDPLAQKVARIYSEANHVQIYYDQVMPPNMAEAHKLLVHQLFELRLTPEQMATSHVEQIKNIGKSQ